jgi:adenosylmethionine-8-amino-7-oxononanoate aminotransferase
VEAALKVAVQYWYNVGRPEKHRFASFEDGYHGDTLGSVSVGYIEQFHRPFKPLLFPSYRVEAPCFGAMAEVIENHADELAAVVVEPLCRGAAGMRMYSARYLQRLAALCAERDVLLIVDEVATGFGRTGTMFAFEQASIDPDIVCLGKSLSAGTLPISATVVKASIHETFRDEPVDRTFYHGHTFAGNPIAAAAAIEALLIYEEERIPNRAEVLGNDLRDRMQRFGDLPGIRDVRCLGMIGAVELEHVVGRAERIRRAMLKAGYLARPLGDVFYVMLPLTVPVSVLEETVDALYEAVASEVT